VVEWSVGSSWVTRKKAAKCECSTVHKERRTGWGGCKKGCSTLVQRPVLVAVHWFKAYAIAHILQQLCWHLTGRGGGRTQAARTTSESQSNMCLLCMPFKLGSQDPMDPLGRGWVHNPIWN
jgi:hypothetical protein